MKTAILFILCGLVTLAFIKLKYEKTGLKQNFNLPTYKFTGGAPVSNQSSYNSAFTSGEINDGLTFTSRVVATDADRATYNKIQRPGIISTPGYLRFEKSAQGSFNQITFDVLTNQGTPNVTERRLNIVDTFTITHLGIFLIKAGASTTASDAEKTAAKLRSNSNALVFTTAGEAAALHGVYNSFLKITINSVVFMEAFDCMRFYRVGTSQKGAGPVTIITDDEWTAPNFAMCEITPTITLNGAGKNDIVLNLPTSSTLSGTASQNFVCCYARGFLNQNAAALNPNL